jgi:uncharacterized protein
MAGNAEVVESLVAAFETGDTDAALACLDPEVELLPIRAQLDRTSYHGHDGYLKLIADLEQDWEGLRLVLEELRESGDQVVAVGRLVARGKASGVQLDAPLGVLYDLRNGRIVRIESFSEPVEALRASGID